MESCGVESDFKHWICSTPVGRWNRRTVVSATIPESGGQTLKKEKKIAYLYMFIFISLLFIYLQLTLVESCANKYANVAAQHDQTYTCRWKYEE